jgi:hypothetical protein
LDRVSDTPESLAESVGRLLDSVGTEVGKLAAFDVVPNSFGRVQIGSVSREPLDFQPVPLLEEEGLHGFAAMRREMIPDQDHLGAADKTLQLFQESDETFGVVAIRLGSGQESGLLAIPSKTERGGNRCFGPMIPAGTSGSGFARVAPRCGGPRVAG